MSLYRKLSVNHVTSCSITVERKGIELEFGSDSAERWTNGIGRWEKECVTFNSAFIVRSGGVAKVKNDGDGWVGVLTLLYKPIVTGLLQAYEDWQN